MVILKGGTVVSGAGCKLLDIWIKDGKIVKVLDPDSQSSKGQAAEVQTTESQTAETEIVDVAGKLLFPGFIDAHTHFDLEVSGTVTADDFISGTQGALLGGTTLIIDFATQNKGESLSQALQNWHRKADGKSSCDYAFHMAISDWNQSVSQELEQMVAAGITSYKIYMTYDAMVLNDKEIYQVLQRMKEIGGLVGVHCENKGIIDARVEAVRAEDIRSENVKDKAVWNEAVKTETAKGQTVGNLSTAAHPGTRPPEAEAEAIHRLLTIARLVDIPVMVVHLSTRAGYQEIENARAQGQKVYVETCPQYLLLEDSKYFLPDFQGGKYVIAPPLRKKADQDTLWEGLRQDKIQTVSTDHCSFTEQQKEAGKDDFTRIPCGMPGVQNRPALLYTYGVREGKITLEQMCRTLSENPARLYGMYPRKGCIAEGSDADIIVWNPEGMSSIRQTEQASLAGYDPFEGFAVTGGVEKVYLHGKLAVDGKKLMLLREGQYILRNHNPGDDI